MDIILDGFDASVTIVMENYSERNWNLSSEKLALAAITTRSPFISFVKSQNEI